MDKTTDSGDSPAPTATLIGSRDRLRALPDTSACSPCCVWNRRSTRPCARSPASTRAVITISQLSTPTRERYKCEGARSRRTFDIKA
jgi:hypothetical protein